MFKPSKYQEGIYNFISKDKGNAIVQAVAGSGKTTTIVEATKLIPVTSKAIFVAFNTAIANELRNRLPRHIEARTLHSFGRGLFGLNSNTNPELDDNKLGDIVKSVLDDFNSNNSVYFGILIKVCNQIKIYNTDYHKFDEVMDLFIESGIEEELTDELFDLITEVMDKNNKMANKIDFADMIYMPVVNKFKSYTYDWVFVDEAQDINKSQFELIKKMCNGHTRIIAVGDRRQSIYAFRGADSNSMNNMKEYFNMKELPLSISYRCPKTVVELAKTIVPEIEVSETAIDGVVDNITFNKIITEAKDGDLILSRTNAPLITVAFALIRNGKKAVIKGRDIGKNLIKLIDKYKVINLNDLIMKIEHFKELQEEKLKMIDRGELPIKRKNSLLAEMDSCETLLVIANDCETISELKNRIESIFTEANVGIVCSTVHKAKGLEAENTFIINYDLMPHPMAKTDIEIEQEYNIKYVAITRAKKCLYILNRL